MIALLVALGCVALGFGLAGGWLSGDFDLLARVNLGLAAAALGAAVLLAVRRAGRRHSGLARRVWLRVLAFALLVLVLTAGLMFLSTRIERHWDLSDGGRYTLSGFTRKVLAGLSVDVQAVLIGAERPGSAVELLLRRYAEHSPRLSVEVRPRGAFAAVPGADGARVVLRTPERTVPVPVPSERHLTQALLALLPAERRTACFLTGHGEAGLEQAGPGGLSGLARALAREAIDAEPLLLAAEPRVPARCALVVIVAPERDLLAHERSALERHVDSGGHVLLFLEPGRPLVVEPVLARFGLAAPDAVVVDPLERLYGSQAPGTEPLVARFTDHPVTEGLDARTRVAFAGARPVQARTAAARGIVWTSPEAYLRASGGDPAEPAPEGSGSTVALAAAGRLPGDGGARLVVFGDADIATNARLGLLYNEDLILNAVHFLTGRETLLDVRPKVRDLYQYPLPAERTVAAFQSAALLVPEVLLALGVLMWWRRRRL